MFKALLLTEKDGKVTPQITQLGGIFNMGGAAVANYVSILEPLR